MRHADKGDLHRIDLVSPALGVPMMAVTTPLQRHIVRAPLPPAALPAIPVEPIEYPPPADLTHVVLQLQQLNQTLAMLASAQQTLAVDSGRIVVALRDLAPWWLRLSRWVREQWQRWSRIGR